MQGKIRFLMSLLVCVVFLAQPQTSFAGGGSAPARLMDKFNCGAGCKQQDNFARAAQERAQREMQERTQREAVERARQQSLAEANKKAQQDALIQTQREERRKAAEVAAQRARDAQERARVAKQQQEAKLLQDKRQAELRSAETKRLQAKQQDQKRLQDKKQQEVRTQVATASNDNNAAQNKEILGKQLDKRPQGKAREEVGAAMHRADQQQTVKLNRAKNKLKPIDGASGPHTSIKRNNEGDISNYATYKPNPMNPTGFDETKRVDIQGSPHFDKKTRKLIPTPHVQHKGNVRAANKDELPK